MTTTQLAAREQVSRLTLKDIGRGLNTAADRFLAFWAGDIGAAKSALKDLPINSELREMLCLAMDTVVARRERQLNRDLDGQRVWRSGR
jgi:hypothetical protein